MVRSMVMLAMLLLLPQAAAVTGLFTDSSGDPYATTPDGRFRNSTPLVDWPNIDILGGGIFEETDDSLSFYLNVTDLNPEQDPPAPRAQPTYFIYFRYGEQGYRVGGTADISSTGDDVLGKPAVNARLELEYQEEVYHMHGPAEMELDFEEDRVIFTVDRAYIRDHNQAPLGRGEVIHDVWATARAMGWFGIPIVIGANFRVELGPPAVSDVAPDNGRRGDEYVTVAGKQLRGGNLLAASEDPVRWTNGEATTFVYFVRLFNRGGIDLDVRLGHEGADPGWQVAFSESLTVPAKSSINVTYHVAIPFGHNHGRLHEFMATFETETTGDWAKQPLAVYWPAIPQPAGHHSQIWMHSRHEPREAPFESVGDRVHGWFSAADANVEQFDEGLPVTADRITGPDTDGRSLAQWTMRLEPSLRMGLDVILEETGRAEFPLMFPVQVQDPELSLEIVHMNTRTIIPKETPVFRTTASLSGPQEGRTVFEFPELQGLKGADLIRHGPKAELEFRLNLTGVFPGSGFENPEEVTPSILPADVVMHLPLAEYHDPLSTTFHTDASATITVGEGGQEKQVNPGKQVMFTFDLHYEGSFESGFQVLIDGINKEWASVVGDQSFRMEPGTTREVAIAVKPPMSATRGDYAELVVRAVGTVNAAVQAGMIVRADVATGVEVADETEEIEAKALQLTAPVDDSAVIWPWLTFPPMILVAGAMVTIWRLRPEWLQALLFWR